MAGVARYGISKLTCDLTNIVVVGVVISKQQARTLANKKDPNGHSSTERAVFNFTIRDSPEECISVSRWGTLDSVTKEAETVHIGDVVDIINARVAVTSEDSAKYRPYTSNPFTLILSDDGKVDKHTGPTEPFKALLHVPNRPAHDYTTLVQVENKDGVDQLPMMSNFLVAVIKLDQVVKMTTRDNREIEKQTVRLLDFTANAVPMDIWDAEIISMATQWQPRETILYIADARVKWDDYKKRKVIGVSSSTVITVDPNVPEAIALRNYARSVPVSFSEMLDSMSSKIPDLSLITDQMSVQQIKAKMEEGETFYALVNAFLTNLTIDGPADPIILRCWHCQALKKTEEDVCGNAACAGKEAAFTASFSVQTSLTDRTGTLENVRLTGRSAERVLGIEADEFLEKDEEEVTALKWKLMLEKWDMKVAVQKKEGKRPVVLLLSCEAANPHEASARGIAMV